jgi:acetylglutamate kinase
MQEAIGKARVLIEALPHIRSFRRKFVVVKLGGSAMEDEAAMRSVLTDIVFMEHVGMWPVLVHGGGRRISEEMKCAGIAPRFVRGMRVTTPEVMRLVARVLIEETSSRISDMIEDVGGRAIPLNGRGSSFLMGRKLRLKDAPDADLGLVGEITYVDREMCYRVADGGLIPVVAPVARFDPDEVAKDGEAYAGCDGIGLLNVNGDAAASAVAAGLGAEKLVDISDVPGVLRDPADPGSLMSTLRRQEVMRLIDEGIVTGGMLPKCLSCMEAIEGGVRKTHIVSAQLPHALLLEIFTDQGIGTEIVA